VKSALNFTILAQKLLSKKLLLLITIFIIMNGVSTNMGIQFNSNILLNKCINTISNEIAHQA
jgi:hypothetical protein